MISLSLESMVPFANANQLADHFTRHQAEFGVGTPADYLALAEAFCYGPLSANMHECTRTNGDLVRFDFITHELGVVAAGAIIRTYHIPPPRRVKAKGGEASYLAWECARIF